MSILTAPLPETVSVGSQCVPIETSFRAGILFEQLALDDNLSVENILRVYYGDRWPEPYEEAINAAIWFYRCGLKPEKPKQESSGHKLKSIKRGYDFEIDAEDIYTSFLQSYGIDLLTEDLHWWVFRALLFRLPDNTPFKQKVYYRTGSTKGMGKKQKKEFEERRKRYALPERGAIDHKLSLMERDDAIKRYVDGRFKEAEKQKA